jgi:uridine kinase
MAAPEYLDIDEFAADVSRRSAGRPRAVVGIDGPGASGKSTLAGLIASRLDAAAVVRVDDFYLPSAGRAGRAGRAGQVGALFDLARLAEQVIKPAATGAALRYQRYDWDRDELTEWTEVPAGAPVIVEGVYSLHEPFRSAYTSSVFCLADRAVRLRRGLERDGEEMRGMWENEWMPAEDAYVADEHPDSYATVVVDSSAGPSGSPRYRIRARRV